MTKVIVAINCGSSSNKFEVYYTDEQSQARGMADLQTGQFVWKTKTTSVVSTGVFTHEVALRHAADAIAAMGVEIVGVGYRTVQGGTNPEPVTAGLLARLEALPEAFAMHVPPARRAMEFALAEWPNAMHVACFDTFFGSSMGTEVTTFAIPIQDRRELLAKRYMYHGLSYEGFALQHKESDELRGILGAPEKARLAIMHLGNGCSMAGTYGGRCERGSLEYGVTEGLVMGTRSGPLDVTVALAMAERYGPKEALRILMKESGLKALCGSGDMRIIVERAQAGDEAADFALQLFTSTVCDQCARMIGAVNSTAAKHRHVAGLPLLDGIIFRAGIGENSPYVRKLILDQLGWTGVIIDDAANEQNATLITTPASSFPAVVVPANEEAVIAHHVRNALLAQNSCILAAE